MQRRTVVTSLAIISVALASCGSDASSTATSAAAVTTVAPDTVDTTASTSEPTADAAFPLEVVNALGSVEVAARPERVVAIGSAELDALLALGIVPTTYVDYSDALLSYQRDALHGAPEPEILSLVDGVPLEAIAAAKPDLIVSLGWTDAQNYPLLNQIAPVVAYVDEPWGDSWQTQLRQIAGAVGQADHGEQVIADVQSQVAAAAAAHPEFAGAGVTFTSVDDGLVCSVDLATSPVLVFLRELSLAPTLDDPDSAYCRELSLEGLGEIDADLMLLFGAQESLESNPLFTGLDGAAVWLDDTMANAVNSPTPLAIPAFLDQVVPAMAAALG